MKKSIVFSICLVLFSAVVYSQNLTISGTVVDDSSRSPISGVSVVVTETKQGVSTDAEGKFRIPVSGSRSTVSLTVSYVGYTTQTVRNVGSQPVTILFGRAQTSLDEVVVIGYQTVSRFLR
jgi:hypothetical protein